MNLILASGSISRLSMLRAVGLSVESRPPQVDERAAQRALGTRDPEAIASALARNKAASVALREQALALGADQVLVDGREVIGKPVDPQDHLARLRSLRGREHRLISAWCLHDAQGVVSEGRSETRLRVRADLTDAELQAYVSTGEGSACAGGYAIEGHGGWLFERVEGDYFNILGLPLFDVLTALRSLGFRYTAPSEAP